VRARVAGRQQKGSTRLMYMIPSVLNTLTVCVVVAWFRVVPVIKVTSGGANVYVIVKSSR
jgi:hypothetical protein